ncbi:endonuclease/exonuclease/phosphatase family protein [uncultured Tateyamaria sp.]|uniref:endonuclease/exonuclease/phosphatase family protein n=1 Tax=uncultured Tateyamaria sp. TaxID=455651 RepID=UPI002628F608|nr:endonuclease/exonuclease/phosphatase family protein [uncultured Tateyamaria sp.]
MVFLIGAIAHADTLRIATYNTELHRDGPGLFLRDLVRGEDDQITAVLAVIAHSDADVLALQGIDYDLTNEALSRFAEATGYPHYFALRPNTGLPTGLDMDGDGRRGGPRDAQGYGRFSGQGGMAVLSRFPIDIANVGDLSSLLWTDFPNALLPEVNGTPFPSEEAQAVQRLSTTGHWIVPIDAPGGTFHLMTFHASPPVFDGPEDRNGKRNHDEIRLWQHVLDGGIGPPPPGPFVIAGDANLDPEDGSGLREGIRNLLSDQRLTNPSPRGHFGTDTVDWDDPVPGNLRVSYVLPSTHWRVVDSGVLWPAPDDALADTVATASRHRLVWADLTLDPAGGGE